MGKDTMAEAAALLGNDVEDISTVPDDVKNFVSGDSAVAGSMIKDDEEMKESSVVSGEDRLTVSGSAKGVPNYNAIQTFIRDGNAVYAVTNASDQTFIVDWDLDLLPKDIRKDFNKYLETKYIQHGLNVLVGKAILVAVMIEGRTINFLQNYLKERQYPIVVPRTVGADIEYKSQFVIPARDSIILTEDQMRSLERFHKRREAHLKPDGKTTYSDWLGFLVIKKLETTDVRNYKRSAVTSEDVRNSAIEVSVEQVRKERKALETRQIEYATE